MPPPGGAVGGSPAVPGWSFAHMNPRTKYVAVVVGYLLLASGHWLLVVSLPLSNVFVQLAILVYTCALLIGVFHLALVTRDLTSSSSTRMGPDSLTEFLVVGVTLFLLPGLLSISLSNWPPSMVLLITMAVLLLTYIPALRHTPPQ
ncbi:MAG: hypothetical protein HRT60_09435 [Dinoroseobacter sp.]|nr:hypothetical protein [Dinoroseobacter sp.]